LKRPIVAPTTATTYKIAGRVVFSSRRDQAIKQSAAARSSARKPAVPRAQQNHHSRLACSHVRMTRHGPPILAPNEYQPAPFITVRAGRARRTAHTVMMMALYASRAVEISARGVEQELAARPVFLLDQQVQGRWQLGITAGIGPVPSGGLWTRRGT
jgi:hypothetical protein